jgi:Ca2+-binding EF-hand superfamily protein
MLGLGGRRGAKTQGKATLGEDERLEIKEAFDLFDTTRSGGLDYHEVKVAMRALGFAVKKEELRALLAATDKAQKGKVDADQFLELLAGMYTKRDPVEEMRKAFRLFDEEGSGTISLRDMKRVARELGEPLTDEELTAMIEEFDTDGDGRVSEADFLAIMKAGARED